ncbi:MAG: VCBS repeat-containing protein [Sedimentisphaerales bacterium]|nr:VCBS repeat-containing protein [Sedimentisphaerales bacterium]
MQPIRFVDRKFTYLLIMTVFVECLVGYGATSGQFQKVVLDKAFRSEGVAVGDINRDGKPDVLAGELWYEAPNWTMHEILPPGQYNPATGYSKTFSQFAKDVNGDGWVDSIITTMMGEPCYWYENPGRKPGHWKQHIGFRSACNETPLYADLFGTGERVPLWGVQPEGYIAWFSIGQDPYQPWDMHIIGGPKAPGSEPFSHGLGIGDLNEDGRRDVLVTAGWWEAPQDRKQAYWTFHPAKLGDACADMLVYDVDGDGDSDVISSSAHNYGIWWHENVDGKSMDFKQHTIYDKVSQTHAMWLIDLNKDGIMDFVTGKRYFAHNGNDPGSKEPVKVLWFEIRRTDSGPQFIMHEIDNDSGLGTQFEVLDIDNNGTLDIVSSNKKGVHIFSQQ